VIAARRTTPAALVAALALALLVGCNATPAPRRPRDSPGPDRR
jgi:hypothetical protein